MADPSAGLAVVASPGGEAAPADPPSGAAADRPPAAGDRWIARAALAITLAPLAVAAVSLVVKVGGSYVPGADHAWTELAVRDVGRHDVLTGLYSKDGWRHPGPLSFYLLAPFYWLTGGASVGLRLGALAVNGGAITGMALIARRRGGLPLMLLTLAGCGLLVHTLGAQVVADPWNLFLPVLPYGLLIFLTWSLACGERWALPVAVFVATLLAQTHVGFVVLAVPLPAAGAAALVAVTGRRNLRSLARPAALSAGLLAVLWLPPLVDVAGSGGSNAADIVRWFQRQPDRSHSLLEGWRVITGQFALIPEWLTTKRTPSAAGQSPFLYRSPVPVLLVAVAAAALVLWRRRGREGRALVLTLALVLALGIVAVAR
ncbi:MAG TPA: hypothetical protein VFI47_27725, partial [Acidimicrobiales bacterium]|nr:hypothetical protein [Acidimicrobiales bacterium]